MDEDSRDKNHEILSKHPIKEEIQALLLNAMNGDLMRSYASPMQTPQKNRETIT
jgi:hypothetical protein